MAYPVQPNQVANKVSVSPLHPAGQERAVQELIDEVQAQVQEETTPQWGNLEHFLGLLIRNEQKRYNSAEIEGVTSFFNSLGARFEDFGQRLKHAFRGK